MFDLHITCSIAYDDIACDVQVTGTVASANVGGVRNSELHAHPRWDCILQTSVFIAVHGPQLRQGRGPQAPPQPQMQDAQQLPQEAAQQPLSSFPRRGSVAGSRWHWLLEDLCAQYPLFTVADLS